MKLLALLLRASRLGVLTSLLLGLLAGASFTGLVTLIERVVAGRVPASSREAMIFAAVAAVALMTRAASQMLANRLNFGVTFQLRMRMCEQLLAAPLRQLEERGAHRLTATLTDDVLAVSAGFATLPGYLVNVAVAVGCIGYVGWLSWPVLLCLLAFLAVGIASYRQPSRHGVAQMRAARQVQDELFAHFRAVIEGTKELKLHDRRRTAFLAEELQRTAAELRRLQVRGSDMFAISASWGVLLFFIFIGLLLFVLPHFMAVERGDVVGYTLVVLYLQQPLQFLTDWMPFLGRAAVALGKIEELGIELERQSGEERAALSSGSEPRGFSRIDLVGVTHSYGRDEDESRFTVGPIDLSLAPGEIVFLVGGNGSGKTTLAKLVTGLYTPESGELRLDGAPVTAHGMGQYRQHFSTVFSDFHLFERLLGLPTAHVAQQASGYLEKLQLSDKVRLNGATLSTTRLSHGQRKRLALLTAYLEDRPVYVFDEWAADQDPEFKEVFYGKLVLDLKARGKAVLIITHDDRYFALADRIVRLDSGRLARPVEAARRREVTS